MLGVESLPFHRCLGRCTVKRSQWKEQKKWQNVIYCKVWTTRYSQQWLRHFWPVELCRLLECGARSAYGLFQEKLRTMFATIVMVVMKWLPSVFVISLRVYYLCHFGFLRTNRLLSSQQTTETCLLAVCYYSRCSITQVSVLRVLGQVLQLLRNWVLTSGRLWFI